MSQCTVELRSFKAMEVPGYDWPTLVPDKRGVQYVILTDPTGTRKFRQADDGRQWIEE